MLLQTSAVVEETKGFVPTPATLDAEVEGEIVQEDGAPAPPVPAASAKPPKVRGGSRRGSQEYVNQSDRGLIVVLPSLEARGVWRTVLLRVLVWLCVCRISSGSLANRWRVLACEWVFVGVGVAYKRVEKSVTLVSILAASYFLEPERAALAFESHHHTASKANGVVVWSMFERLERQGKRYRKLFLASFLFLLPTSCLQYLSISPRVMSASKLEISSASCSLHAHIKPTVVVDTLVFVHAASDAIFPARACTCPPRQLGPMPC